MIVIAYIDCLIVACLYRITSVGGSFVYTCALLYHQHRYGKSYFSGISILRASLTPDATSRTLRALPLNGFERSEWTACNNFSFQMQLWIDKENRFAYKSTSPKQLQILFLKKASPVFRSQHLNCP